MAERKRLTAEFARRVPLAGDGRTRTYSDRELRGLYLRVNCASKTWIAQRQVDGRQVRVTLGRYPELGAAEAREAARRALAAIGEGRNPAEERRRERARGITLQEALELHLASRPLAPQTDEDYRRVLRLYLGDWLGRPLREIGRDRAGVRERHQRATERHGATSADYAFRVLRAVYNRARREDPELPPNPCANVDYNGVPRREVDLDPERLRAWGVAVLALPNEVRRDLHLFMLLTGMRRTAACEVRVADVDLDASALHVPRPKGGEARAFDVPLSRALVDLVRHRIEGNGVLHRGTPWLFPARGKRGRVFQVHEPSLGGLHGHALRHAYASLALEAGVPLAELKFLLNHSVNDVTFGYLRPGLAHLRGCQERASARVLEVVGLRWEAGTWPPDQRGLLLASDEK